MREGQQRLKERIFTEEEIQFIKEMNENGMHKFDSNQFFVHATSDSVLAQKWAVGRNRGVEQDNGVRSY